ncbi:MAG: hypothetical protein ACK4J0_02255, partial [Candidatus Anstonellaceae archaeon]
VQSVKFDFPNYFTVVFDSSKTTKDKILSLEVFKSYPATLLSTNQGSNPNADQNSLISTPSNNLAQGSCSLSTGGCSCGAVRGRI